MSVFAFEVVVDRAILMTVLLLMGLTWLLYKLTIFLAPKSDRGRAQADASEVRK